MEMRDKQQMRMLVTWSAVPAVVWVVESGGRDTNGISRQMRVLVSCGVGGGEWRSVNWVVIWPLSPPSLDTAQPPPAPPTQAPAAVQGFCDEISTLEDFIITYI